MPKEFQPLLSPPPISTDEWRHVLVITIPLVMLQILEYLPQPILNMYIGHLALDESESRVVLGASGLCSLYFTTTAYSVIIGFSTAMDALTAQAHGKGRGAELGVVLQTAALCAGALCVPLALVLYFSGFILHAWGQPDEIAIATQVLLRWFMLGIPLVFAYEFFKRVLQGQNIVWPIVGSIAAGVAVALTLGYVLVFYTGLGYIGGTMGMMGFYTVTPVLLFQLLHTKNMHYDWEAARAKVPAFLCLSFNGWIMFLSEFAGIAGTSFMAGSLPNAGTALSANTIYSGFRSLFGMVYLGIGFTSSVRVGNALGGNLPVRAEFAAWQTVKISLVWAGISTLAMVVIGPLYATLYTQDPDVLADATTLFYVTAPFQVMMGIWGAVQGTFRGSGKPHQGAIANILAFVVVGFPLAWSLSKMWGIVGLWLGVSGGFCLCAIYGMYWLLHADWDAIADVTSQQV
ncbi:hypothetical protein, variant 1 [Aphanomyces invadans]|uniref:MATE efflux family protein n=1 Tax=Aphanomyces invadans TaxID=157072 RepID=A0A024TVB7_9STRA|nr:hypothetical protein, variant 1 [Aphanomyces invadans]ETV97576.1 hypothetical protein, variant 1 [Aphanomyces invadans]|eukprot:XP_008873787.1 hypothetical protein, variant 1 [Aphanomyces invadans]